MNSRLIQPVILCGGTGTRLWPISRQSLPKQFLSLNFTKDHTLLQRTQERIKNIENILNPILICNEQHRFIVAEQMRQINTKPSSIILEPFGRNTAPAITIAALKALEFNDDPILLVLSSDHEIKDEDRFLEIIFKGLNYAYKERLVTFGVVPTSPETGYGYIKSKEPLDSELITGSIIESFIEKPDKKNAQEFIKDKRYTWNSGIFLFKAKTILEELSNTNPHLVQSCKKSLDSNLFDMDFQRLEKDYFLKCPNISIDFALMEKTKKATVLPLNVGWNDVGSWNSVWEISKKDCNGNVIEGNVFTRDTENCLIKSENRLITTIGLKDFIVIETSDAILISDKNKSQNVKNIVDSLKDKLIPEAIDHRKCYRPWGNFESLLKEKQWQVKLIEVKPNQKISLQKHKYRSEHWIVVNGIAKVEINGKQILLNENQSTYIPQGSKHRLSNPGKSNLKIIEIQTGSYIGEDDIERFEDIYGRVN
tara:strand:+ start:590 stop:2029 length:1440 start_codon:yes stop_codon:yes gene_type:complete